MFVYTRETYKDYPDYYVDRRRRSRTRQKLTDANPQQDKFAWSSGSKLVDYNSAKGDKLQGALFLPANYEPGKKYPTVVYIYEKLSQGTEPLPRRRRRAGSTRRSTRATATRC